MCDGATCSSCSCEDLIGTASLSNACVLLCSFIVPGSLGLLGQTARVKRTDLDKARTVVGTYPDMCPEKERYMRETRSQLSIFELVPGTDQVRSCGPRSPLVKLGCRKLMWLL